MTIWRNIVLASTAALVLGGSPLAARALRPSGTISIAETQFGFLVGGNIGGQSDVPRQDLSVQYRRYLDR